MRTTRRGFLRTLGLASAAAFLPLPLARRARAVGGEPVLVVIFQRGGADGLNLVVPHGDPGYYALRPVIQVARSSVLDLDGFFGLHPSLVPLLPVWQRGDLAIVHAVGSPHPTRSHFDAMDFMERAAPGDYSVIDGWLSRALVALHPAEAWAGVSFGTSKIPSLDGAAKSLAMSSLDGFVLSGRRPAERRSFLQALYAFSGDPLQTRAEAEAFEAMDALASVSRTSSAAYSGTQLGQDLKNAALLVKADMGVRAIAIDSTGWDHHESEFSALPPVASDLAAGLAAFLQDLGAHAGRTLVLVMTEFGRGAAENGSFGTDHGHGSAMLALGGSVAGGRVRLRGGAWPGLSPQALDEGRDLAVTTDFRDVLAEVVQRHLGVSNLAGMFPGFSTSTARFPGLFG
jgi:uncharacterized protein (DUF1501 family)